MELRDMWKGRYSWGIGARLTLLYAVSWQRVFGCIRSAAGRFLTLVNSERLHCRLGPILTAPVQGGGSGASGWFELDRQSGSKQREERLMRSLPDISTMAMPCSILSSYRINSPRAETIFPCKKSDAITIFEKWGFLSDLRLSGRIHWSS